MFRKLTLLVGLALTLVLAATVYAQGPEPQHSDPFWQASYFNNTTLSGSPVLERTETDLNWDWGTGSPDASVEDNYFSARWSRYLRLEAGTYRFTATSDDGIRVYVDGCLIIDKWYNHPVETFSADVSVITGHHLVVVEYYENRGQAVARLSWGTPEPPIQNWRGEYFNNPSLSGSPVLVRDDANIDFNWGYGSPAGGLPSDGFSVRWTRTVNFGSGGMYRFTTTTDDGVRLWVNNHLLIDKWQNQAPTSHSGNLYVTGNVPIKMEYYENRGQAVARLSWGTPEPPIQNWRGEYFNNLSLSGSPVLVRDDAKIDFNWGGGSPAAGVPADRFSVRWTRTVNFGSGGMYQFTTTTDDGVRLWVNNHLLIDKWQDQPSTSYSGRLYVAGDVPIKMEYYENGGVASARLLFGPAEGDLPVPPTGVVVVDDTSAGFVKGGSVTGWRYAAEGYGKHLTWTQNNDWPRPNYNWARWYPSLTAGRYEVFVYIPERYSTTSGARYWVSHSGGYTLRVVNQSTNGGRWVSLGIYQFRGTREDYVSLADATYEAYLSRLIAFDAAKWEPR